MTIDNDGTPHWTIEDSQRVTRWVMGLPHIWVGLEAAAKRYAIQRDVAALELIAELPDTTPIFRLDVADLVQPCAF